MIKAVIFDIDGTLLDSFESNLAFFQELLKRAGYQPPTKEEYAPLFHVPLRDVVRTLAGLTNEVEIERIFELAHTATDIRVGEPLIHDGVEETIKTLSKEYPLGVATGRIKTYVYEPPLHRIQAYFKATVTYEDTKNHKPSPEPLLLAAKLLGVVPGNCVYVGDVETDMASARAAGMKFILYSKNNLEGADARTSDFKKIPELIRGL